MSRWLTQEDQLRQQSCNTRCISSCCRADWPELEMQFHGEFKEQRAKGLKVKAWWFKNRADQLSRELYPTKLNDDGTIPFLISKYWFERLQNRFSVSLRATTNHASEEPERKLQLAHEFHASIIAVGEFRQRKLAIWIRHLCHLISTPGRRMQIKAPRPYGIGRLEALGVTSSKLQCN